MSPQMRWIFAQVHRKSVSMGSRRNFSSSSAAGDMKESNDTFSFLDSVKLGLFAWASLGMYKVYKNYYPKLVICQEEYKRRLQHQNELFEQAKRDRDL